MWTALAITAPWGAFAILQSSALGMNSVFFKDYRLPPAGIKSKTIGRFDEDEEQTAISISASLSDASRLLC